MLMITRKIPFTLIFTLLFFPLSGQVRAADVSTLLIDGAAKGVGGWAAGQAMDSIFPPQDAEPSRAKLAEDIANSTTEIKATINTAVTEIEGYIDQDTLTLHLTLLGQNATQVAKAINAYQPKTTMSSKPPTPNQITTNDTHIQNVIDASFAFSLELDKDIKIAKGPGSSGFWRSFPTYVSNKVTNVAFVIEQWKTKQAQDGFLADGNEPFTITTKIVENIEDIYNHLEKDVPTLPVSNGSHVQNGNPKLQNVNCALRTDPDTQLFTRKGEFISRYRGVHDIADRLPDPTRYWMMYAHCRSNLFSEPDVYYGWGNVNFLSSAGKTVGPLTRGYDCQQAVTFGRCKSRGSAYGCTQSPIHSKNSSPSNEIGNHHGRMLYTKYLWADGPNAISGVASRDLFQNKLPFSQYRAAEDKFNGYLKIFENTVCKNDPSGKNIAAQIPAAPELPSLKQALFDNDTYTFTKDTPDKIQNSLPLTVIKVPHKAIAGITTNNAYYFIKRNFKDKFPELSKPYQSAMSAAHNRSLHYFTEFTDHGLPAAYCQIASMVSIGDLILSTLESKIKQQKLEKTKYTPSLSDIANTSERIRQVSHMLGITKESAKTICPKLKSNNIVASIKDAFTLNLDQSDHKMRSCMKVAAIDAYEQEGQKFCTTYPGIRKPGGCVSGNIQRADNGPFDMNTYRLAHAACGMRPRAPSSSVLKKSGGKIW
jgi:hypothetical protein